MFRSTLSLALLLPMAALADDMPARAATCVSCHSADGNPLVAGVPILAGQRADYLAASLRAYRDGGRRGGRADVMQKFAAPLSEADIKEISQWFSAN